MYTLTRFKRDDNKYIGINMESLNEVKDSLEDFVTNEPLINKNNFNKTDFPQEIKFNNAIEGIDDEISDIEKILNRTFISINRDKKRITNLYKGYKYILKHNDINKDSLKELYTILSSGLLLDNDKNRMGEYYREGPVYILRGNSLERFFNGVDYKNIDEYMNILFDYINNSDNSSDIDCFIKSQIIHCYLVYIHPYFDVNGRTSRTLGMWYLLNNNNQTYMTFNRSISFLKGNYDKSLVKLRETGDMTIFLKYILEAEKLELEKEYVINNIEKNINKKLTNEEYLMLEYFLSMNGHLTLLDLISMYNSFNNKKKKRLVLEEDINPLIKQDIIKVTTCTNHNIVDGIANKRILLNEELLDIDKSKIKKLKIDKYIKKDQD